MGSKKDLTATQKGAIIYGFLKKDSYYTIAANVGCEKSVIGNVIRKYRETGTTEPQRKHPGRSSLLIVSDRSILKTLVINGNRCLNAAQVTTIFTAQTKLHVSKKTIRCALKKENLRSCIARPKPLISPINALNRLTWCLARKDWTARHFRRILWTDKSSFQLFQQVFCRVWHEPDEEWNTECLSCTVKRSPSHMFWGCFSWYGVGPLVPLFHNATGASHVEILRKYAMPTLKNYPGNIKRGHPLFQQDNARPHVSKIATAFLKDNKVRILDWPAQSPDLNPDREPLA